MTRAKHSLKLVNIRSKEMLLNECKKNYYYVSYFKWLNDADNGNFLKQFDK